MPLLPFWPIADAEIHLRWDHMAPSIASSYLMHSRHPWGNSTLWWIALFE